MQGTGTIQYIPHNAIDKSKWDNCIREADNSLVYAYSFYLDHMSPGWDALVEGDYAMVMPLTHNKKFGIPYLYQPFLTAQLGVFGKGAGPAVAKFIDAIPRRFKFIDVALNTGNNLYAGNNVISRNNYVLDLRLPYVELQKNYRDHVRRNLKKAEESGCTPAKDIDVENIINLAVKQMRVSDRNVDLNISRFRTLFAELNRRDMVTTYGVSCKDQLQASCVFFHAGGRAYYILVGNDPAGKNTGASHALIDAFIRDNAGKEMILDFEGSDIKSLAFYYSSFGAVKETYPAIRINRLPWFLKWVKRS